MAEPIENRPHYLKKRPPLMSINAPVTNRAASLTRNSTVQRPPRRAIAAERRFAAILLQSLAW